MRPSFNGLKRWRHCNNFFEISAWFVWFRGGHGGEISRDKTINTINYFPGKFVTIIDKILTKSKVAQNDLKHILNKKNFCPPRGQGLSLWKVLLASEAKSLASWGAKFFFVQNVFQIILSNFGFFINFLSIITINFTGKIIYPSSPRLREKAHL